MPNLETPSGTPEDHQPAPPPQGSRLHRYLTYGMLAWIAILVLYFLRPDEKPDPAEVAKAEDKAKAEGKLKALPPRGFDPVRDVHDSVQAAKLVDGLLTKSTPGVEKIIAFVDVSLKDGHLVVHFKDVYNKLTPADKAPLEDLLVTLWGQTEYVADREWNPAVEFVEHDGKSTRSRMKTPGALPPGSAP